MVLYRRLHGHGFVCRGYVPARLHSGCVVWRQPVLSGSGEQPVRSLRTLNSDRLTINGILFSRGRRPSPSPFSFCAVAIPTVPSLQLEWQPRTPYNPRALLQTTKSPTVFRTPREAELA